MSMKRLAASSALASFGVSLFAPTLQAGDGDALLHALSGPGNRLITLRAGDPQHPISRRAIQGTKQGELLVALDTRPANGDLVALSDQSTLYVIDPSTATATPIGSASFTPALSGTSFGFDFNPLVDRIRCVSDAEQNLRLHPDTGAVAGVDTPLAYAAGDLHAGMSPDLVGSAYTNPFAGSSVTTLYGIDSAQDALVTQGSPNGSPVSPNAGTLFTIGSLGVDASGSVAFDISVFGGAFAAIAPTGATVSTLYSIDLASGAATAIGPIPAGTAIRGLAIAAPRKPRAFAVTSSNKLISFPAGQPAKVTVIQSISGLAIGEDVLALDFRPATNELYALASTSRLYRIDTTTAVATLVAAASFNPPLAGLAFGMDFNPTVDRIRVVSDAEQNLRLHPVTGAVAGTDSALAFDPSDSKVGQDPAIVASAYTNDFPGSSVTTLYGIDANSDSLVLQGSTNGAPVSPNAGTLFTVGALGVDTGELAGFDISDLGGALATLTVPGATSTQLHRLNLATGASTLVGTIAGGETIRGFAIEPVQLPRLYALTASGRLISFLAGTPDVLVSNKAILGLAAGESLVGMDFRPSTGELIAVTNQNRVVEINRVSARVTTISTTAFTPALNGTEFGFDFNPVPDRIRLISDAEQNLRLNPITGAVAAVDTALAFDAADPNFGVNPEAVAAAYTSAFAGAKKTTLFDLDSSRDALLRQGSPDGAPISPNAGTLFTIGSLGLDASAVAGFDISTAGGAFASITLVNASTSQLHRVNLLTGALTSLGTIGGGEVIRDLAILPPGLD